MNRHGSLASFAALCALFGTAGTLITGSAARGTPHRKSPAAHHPAARLGGVLPLQFEPNMGQFGREVRFASRGAGYSLLLGQTSVSLVLAGQRTATDVGRRRNPELRRGRSSRGTEAAVRFCFVGSNPRAQLRGTAKTETRSNYLTGADPARWHIGIPNFRQVRCAGLYPGIDALYYGAQGAFEYDLIAHPGSEPGRIRMAIAGAARPQLTSRGDLLVHTSAGDVRKCRPVVYQEVGKARQRVEARYRLTGKNLLAFELGPYDRSRDLIIDPVLLYAAFIGGSGADQGNGVAVDPSGNTYVVGTTTSATFNGGAQTPLGAPGKGEDVFISKINAAATQVVYTTFLGGSGADFGQSIAVDASGSAYLVGSTTSGDFPVTSGVPLFEKTLRGTQDAFITKLSATGSALIYSGYLGGNQQEFGEAVTVDDQDRAYVTGATESSDFPLQDAVQPTFGGGGLDAFVTRIAADGKTLDYSTFLGGPGADFGRGIAVDLTRNAHVTGSAGLAFPTTAGAAQEQFGGGTSDAFAVMLDPVGHTRLYSTYLGGGSADTGRGIAVDSSGNAYVAGITFSTDYPTGTPGNPTQRLMGDPGDGASDAFVTKLGPAGDTRLYSTYLGGSGADFADAIAVDASGIATVVGGTSSPDFRTAVSLHGFAGGADAFVTRLDANGTGLIYSTLLGGSGYDEALSVRLDPAGNAYVAGVTTSGADFGVTGGLSQNFGGSTDAFIAKVPPLVPTPAAPSGLAISDVTDSSIQLTWESLGTGVSSFILQRSAGGTGTPVSILLSAAARSFTDTGLNPGVTYTYRLQAVGPGGASPFSTPVSASTIALPVPTGITATPLSRTSVRVGWQPTNSSLVTAYQVERRSPTDVGFTGIAVVPANVTTYTDTGLQPNSLYLYQVRSVGAGGTLSTPSIAATARTQGIPAPTGLHLTEVTTTTASLGWTDNASGAFPFLVQRRPASGGDFVTVATTSPGATSYTDSGLVPFQVYEYRVLATSPDGSSDASNSVPAQTLPFSLEGLVVTPRRRSYHTAFKGTRPAPTKPGAQTKSVTVTNRSKAPMTITAAILNRAGTAFSLSTVSTTMLGTGGKVLPAGGSLELQVQYQADKKGSFAGVLTVTGTAGSANGGVAVAQKTVSLQGTTKGPH